jgi:SEC-C motif domain protein
MGAAAQTPEALMRSRYTAYTIELEQYVLQTWHESTRPSALNLTKTKWLGLSIVRTESISDDTATVEFIARYKVGGDRAQRMHEISQFKLINNRWYYLSGLIT